MAVNTLLCIQAVGRLRATKPRVPVFECCKLAIYTLLRVSREAGNILYGDYNMGLLFPYFLLSPSRLN